MKTWQPIGSKKPAKECATLENYLKILESRHARLEEQINNADKYFLSESDIKFYKYEVLVLEQVMVMAYDLAYRGYETVKNTNYSKGVI